VWQALEAYEIYYKDKCMSDLILVVKVPGETEPRIIAGLTTYRPHDAK
jgi:hypothetical protein